MVDFYHMKIFKNKSMLIFCFYLIGAFLSSNVLSASFDCSKATTAMERLICSNDYVSELDAELGQEYKKALVKYADRKDMLIKQQRNWIKWIRSQCKDPSCLVTLYEARIGELVGGNNVVTLDGSDKPNFILTGGRGMPLCEEYLNILNNTPGNELRACKLPDLSKSKIKPVEFKLLTGEKLRATTRLVYEQVYGNDWERVWSEREKEFLSGYRIVGEAFWDLDNDGVLDQVIKESFPNHGCVVLGRGESSELLGILKSKWKSYSHEEKINSAKEFGYENSYVVIQDGKVSFVDADNFVLFEGQYLSIDHGLLTLAQTTNVRAARDWVKIWVVATKRNDQFMNYGPTPAKCKFWLNK